MKAWHITGDTLRDGRPIPAVGETLTHDGPIKWCESGLYASLRLIDALGYARGSRVHRVECRRIEERDENKFVCHERTILWSVDAEEVFGRFARLCALDVIHLWAAPPVVVKYLKTGDPELRAAARAAAWDAAGSAARAAAGDAAWDLARDAAGSAARYVVARDAAWGAVRTKQNRRLTSMVVAAHRRVAA